MAPDAAVSVYRRTDINRVTTNPVPACYRSQRPRTNVSIIDGKAGLLLRVLHDLRALRVRSLRQPSHGAQAEPAEHRGPPHHPPMSKPGRNLPRHPTALHTRNPCHSLTTRNLALHPIWHYNPPMLAIPP